MSEFKRFNGEPYACHYETWKTAFMGGLLQANHISGMDHIQNLFKKPIVEFMKNLFSIFCLFGF